MDRQAKCYRLGNERDSFVNESTSFHVLTVGWDFPQLADFWDRIGAKSRDRFSHILHPRDIESERTDSPARADVYFLRRELRPGTR